MGTPQMRWREMHQSGRVAIMLEMRSSPQAGSQVTVFDDFEVRWRKVVSGWEPTAVAFGSAEGGGDGGAGLFLGSAFPWR